MNRTHLLAAAICATLLAGCGEGKSPTAPSVATPISTSSSGGGGSGTTAGSYVATVTDENGRPVGGAKVTIGSHIRGTNENGQVQLDVPIPLGSTVIVEHESFRSPRTIETTGSADNIRLFSLKASLGVTDAFLDQIVFSRGDEEPRTQMIRVNSNISVIVDPAIRADTLAMNSSQGVRFGIETVNRLLNGRLTVVLVDGTEPLPGTIPFYLVLDPSVPAGRAAECLYNEVVSGTITKVTLRFAAIYSVRSSTTVAHEIGHGIGFGHHMNNGIMRANGAGFASTNEFTPAEGEALRYMLSRPPGTKYADDTRNLR